MNNQIDPVHARAQTPKIGKNSSGRVIVKEEGKQVSESKVEDETTKKRGRPPSGVLTFPRNPLKETVSIAQAIWDKNKRHNPSWLCIYKQDTDVNPELTT